MHPEQVGAQVNRAREQARTIAFYQSPLPAEDNTMARKRLTMTSNIVEANFAKGNEVKRVFAIWDPRDLEEDGIYERWLTDPKVEEKDKEALRRFWPEIVKKLESGKKYAGFLIVACEGPQHFLYPVLYQIYDMLD